MAEEYKVEISLDAGKFRKSLSKVGKYAKDKMVEITGSISQDVEVALIEEMGKIATSVVALFDLIPKEIHGKIPNITSVVSKIDLSSKIQKESKEIIQSIDKILPSFGKVGKEFGKENTFLTMGIDAWKNYAKSINLTDIAKSGLNFLKTADGISLVIGAISFLSSCYEDYNKKVNATIYALKDKNAATTQTIENLKQLGGVSKDNYNNQTVELDILQKHIEYIKANTDESGRYIGVQDKMNLTISELNNTFPELNAKYDENTGKILDQNGKVIDLTTSVEKLIESKRVEAYLEANKEEYLENYKAQNKAIKENIDYQERLNEIQKELGSYDPELHTKILLEEGLDAGNKYLESLGLTQDAIYKLHAEQNELNKNMANNDALIASTNGITMAYEGVAEALASGNIEEALGRMSAGEGLILYDPNKGAEQMAALDNQISEINERISSTKELQAQNPEMADAYQKELDGLNEYLALAQEQRTIAENAQLVSATTNAIDSGYAYVNNTIPIVNGIQFDDKFVNIRARLIGFEEAGGGSPWTDSGGYTGYASETASVMSMMKTAEEVIGGISYATSHRVSRMNIPIVTSNTSDTPVTVHQSNNFYQPIERPSDVTRKIEQVNKSLLKRR